MFNRKGLDKIYKAALGVAASRPELFVGNDARSSDQIAQKLLSKFANVLTVNDDRSELASQLGVAVLDVARENVYLYLDQGQPWEDLSAQLLESLLLGLKTACVTAPTAPAAEKLSPRNASG